MVARIKASIEDFGCAVTTRTVIDREFKKGRVRVKGLG